VSSDRVPTRPIDARRRRKLAHRDAMIDSASELFATVGFAGTTMAAVAAGAGMSVQSVYFAFHTKADLLRAAIDRAAPEISTGSSEHGPDRALAALVDEAVRALETTGALALAAHAAAPGDEAVAQVRDWYDERRARAAVSLVNRLRAQRGLATGVTARRVVDVVYGLLSPQLHAVLVRERGWSSKRYAAWATDAIGRALWG
jgi:AcrR family transcriptional regulator